MATKELDAYPHVAALLDDWPGATTVFLRHRMGCPGCGMARFETLDEVLDVYGLCGRAFKDELRRVALATTKAPGGSAERRRA